VSEFDTVVVVDWSAGKDRGATPKKDAIWIGLARDGVSEEPIYCRTRKVAEAQLNSLLDRETQANRRVLAAFDFPFGYPKGFARRVTGQDDPFAMWRWLEAHVQDNEDGGNNRFEVAVALNGLVSDAPGPFWGKPWQWESRYPEIPFGKVRDGVDFAPFGEFRACDRLVRETSRKTMSSCFQLNGNPTVGGQVLTGLPVLERLRKRSGVGVWPFEDTDGASVVLAEVWPSLVDAAVARSTRPGEVRDSAQVRLLSLALSRLDAARMEQLMDVPEVAREEAWILGAGAHEELVALVDTATPLKPPRLKDDCFALPPGVDWTPVDDALGRLRAALAPVVRVETCVTSETLGRVLAKDAVAFRANPPAANSAVDGFGFAHRATGAGDQVLPLVKGRAAAGAAFVGVVPEGKAIRILTGAILPEGVDTVVLEEDTSTDGTQIAFEGPVKPGANARKAGEDVDAGAIVVSAGKRLGSAELALLAATGVVEVAVFQPLRVGVLSTGDEIVASGSTSDPARTYDANRPMLLSLLSEWRMDPVDLGHVGDDRAEVVARLGDAAQDVDVILTSGGASAGDEDHVSAALEDAGVRHDWRIALKPGRPLALGMWDGIPVFALPGNPVAALVCAMIFARPALALMGGQAWSVPQGFMVPAAFEKNKKPGRREYLRARINADGAAEVFHSEGSGRISGLAWADGLVELKDGPQTIKKGDPVRYIPYASFR